MEKVPYYFERDALYLLDQTKLPYEEIYLEIKTLEDGAKAIEDMKIRGAPAIGCFAAFVFYIGIKEGKPLDEVVARLSKTRPTAINLFFAINRMKKAFLEKKDLKEEAFLIEKEEKDSNSKMGQLGASLLQNKRKLLTHCNTGSLATPGIGTALGVIKTYFKRNKDIVVYVDETRPYLQGSRLTAWELTKENIDHYIICDSLSPYLIARGEIEAVLVGADRITNEGFVANKVGTFSLALACKYNNVPFYVVAPSSSFDLNISKDKDIPLEIRNEKEIKEIFGIKISPDSSKALNVSFDITPPSFISAIITEKGIISPVSKESILKVLGNSL